MGPRDAQTEQNACRSDKESGRGELGKQLYGQRYWWWWGWACRSTDERHAWRLKPSTLAADGSPGGHARRLKPSSLAVEDLEGSHARRLKPSTLAGGDGQGRRATQPELVQQVLMGQV